MSNKILVKGKWDYLLFFATIGMVIVGIIMVYSSSYFVMGYERKDPNALLNREIFFVILGGIVLWVCSRMNYRRLRALVVPLNILTLGTYSLLYTPLAVERHNSVRWVELLNGRITFMPSELAKYVSVITIAYLLSQKRSEKNPSKNIFLIISLIAYLFLTLRQPDLSTTLVLASTMVAVLFFGGLKTTVTLGMAGFGILGTVLVIMSSKEKMQRVEVFFDPFIDPQNKGYQIIQSLYAIASGGLLGTGIGSGKQKMIYLPYAYNDYIFSIFAEELGFLGCIILIGLLSALVIRGFKVASNAPDKFSTLIAAGISSQLAIQSIMNMYVSTNMIPSTGIPFPIISYGGTSLVMTLGAIGLVLGISRWEQKTQKAFDNVENKNYHSLERRTGA